MNSKYGIISWIILVSISCNGPAITVTPSDQHSYSRKLLEEADSLQKNQCYWEAIQKYTILLPDSEYQARSLEARAKAFQAIGRPDLEIEDSKSLLYLADISFGRKADLSLHISESYPWDLSPDSVIKYLHICLENSSQDENGDSYDKLLYSTLAESYIDCKNWAMAFQMLDSASDHNARLIEVVRPRAQLYSEIGQLDSALYWANFGIDFAEALPHEKIDCHLLKHRIFEKMGLRAKAKKEIEIVKNIKRDMYTNPEITSNWLSITLMEIDSVQ